MKTIATAAILAVLAIPLGVALGADSAERRFTRQCAVRVIAQRGNFFKDDPSGPALVPKVLETCRVVWVDTRR
ncbi:MAG: hypothetical protein V3S01_09295 [Dehalococcoidia bacterium]